MARLTLYHTAGCHLCEEAEALVMQCLAMRGMAQECLKRVDIADDEELLERFGLTIPVLRDEIADRELNWPFVLKDILSVLMQGSPANRPR